MPQPQPPPKLYASYAAETMLDVVLRLRNAAASLERAGLDPLAERARALSGQVLDLVSDTTDEAGKIKKRKTRIPSA